ncbi:TetR/AcrR family transcriptional regulator [Thauera linaloolentis]|uniref:Transcriptional regulator n=1 Tax=Thauera linaloolentis (strain DSM 12138 / JCM 21573 / CCUG 41526 / CIP 105981 / IAM 15112 / NBRC 102519 / 47Lol) TaxID=1123367 RepID=N6Y2T4_THAL4|nr:TetR/AcrR family transcriptional regulator [Thauera linaloolentis]ENO88506.1 transcriptional regulator [Thauera linaloolentis 47Lol = DSM 12138]MCM8567469.1 TetR/AcrR family transcriptional regulator [Thauera linaloolentis]
MAYRKTERVEARLADNRQRILDAARRLVSEGGWAEAQISHVASAAGIATGSVYRYFPSKADLCVEVLSVVSQREVDVLEAIANSADAPCQTLHVAVSAFVERAMRNRRLAYALIAEPCDREIDEARLVYRHAISKQIMRIVKDGQAAGDFRADLDPSIAATVIVGGFMESLIGPLSPLNADFDRSGTHGPDAVRALASQIADVCCAAVTAQPGKAASSEPHPRRQA